MINAILRLRRDNDYNYEKIKDTFIPANGEICLVDTSKYGLQVVCGDGVTTFGQLKYLDVIVQGYYSNGKFYSDSALTKEIVGLESKLYFNILDKTFFYFYNGSFIAVSSQPARANDSTYGVLKLYSILGQNTDGTMTQKAITDELNEKIEISLNIDEELLIFDNDIN